MSPYTDFYNYHAANSIIIDGNITLVEDRELHLHGATEVEIMPGFIVDPNANFSIQIDNDMCTNSQSPLINNSNSMLQEKKDQQFRQNLTELGLTANSNELNNFRNFEVAIYSIDGKFITRCFTTPTSSNIFTEKLNGYPNGVYIAHWFDEGNKRIKTEKIIKSE